MQSQVRFDKRKLARLCARRMIKELALFGAAPPQVIPPDADVNLLVTFREDAPHSLRDWLDTLDELRRFFGRPVAALNEHSLRGRQRRNATFKTRQIIFAA